jgi:hypothetical protein
MSKNLVRFAAEEQLRYAFSPVRTHDDQATSPAPRDIDDRLCDTISGHCKRFALDTCSLRAVLQFVQ